MNSHIRTLSRVTAVLMLIIPVSQVHAIIKCQDKDGNWHMGDTLPPECVQEGYQELNERGLVVDETERAPTEEEIAEQKRKEAMLEEQKHQEEEQARKDKILLDTFSSVEDIELARDGKIAAIETTIGLAEKRNEKLQAELDKHIEKAAAEERAGKQPSEVIVKDIETLRRQIKNNKEFISDKRSEQETVKAEYAENVQRFKELKSIE